MLEIQKEDDIGQTLFNSILIINIFIFIINNFVRHYLYLSIFKKEKFRKNSLIVNNIF